MAGGGGWQHPHLRWFDSHRTASPRPREAGVAGDSPWNDHCLHSDIQRRLAADVPLAPAEVVSEEGIFDLNVMQCLMPPTPLGVTFASYSPHVAAFQACTKRLHAVLFGGEVVGGATYRRVVQRHSALFSRSVHQHLLPDVLELHASHGCLGSYTAFLVLSTVLERAIGDAFHRRCQGRQPVPHLLRDLLASPEVAAATGPQLLHWLRVLLGPAYSLNLRNLLWHGFIGPTQFEPMYTTALVALCFEFLSRQPEVEAAAESCLSFRPTVSLSGSDVDVTLLSTLAAPSGTPEYAPAAVQTLVAQSFFLLLGEQQEVFFAAYGWYNCNQPMLALSLLLPLLEHALRRVFVVVNDLPEWMLKGQYRVLFCTLEHILSCWIPELSPHTLSQLEHPADAELEVGEADAPPLRLNRLRAELGDGLMDLLWDLFLNAAGPRLRDKLAHGEALNHDIDSGLVAETLATVLLLCKRYSISPAPSDLPNVTKPPSPVDDCVQYTHWEYVPRFHPRARLLRGLVASVTAWMHLRDMALVVGFDTQLADIFSFPSALQPNPAFCPPYASAEWQDYNCAFSATGYTYVKRSHPPSVPAIVNVDETGIPVCLLVFGDAAVQRQLHPELHTPAVPRNHAVDHRQVEGLAWQLLASTAAGCSDLSTSPGAPFRHLPLWAPQAPPLSQWYRTWQEGQVAATDCGLESECRTFFFSLMELNRQTLVALTATMEAFEAQHLQLFDLVTVRRATTGQRKAYGTNLLLVRPLMWFLRWLILEVERDIWSWNTEVRDDASYRDALKRVHPRVTISERLRNQVVTGQVGKAVLELLRFSCSKANLPSLDRLCGHVGWQPVAATNPQSGNETT